MNATQKQKLQVIYEKATRLLNELEARSERKGDDDDAIYALDEFVIKLESDLTVKPFGK